MYHLRARCVRRAYLCGKDRVTGKDYSHRKLWLLRRHEQLAGLFTIDVQFRAELSNHLHMAVRHPAGCGPAVIPGRRGPPLADHHTAGQVHGRLAAGGQPREARRAAGQPERLREGGRKRLSDISWYMAVLLENIAADQSGGRHTGTRLGWPVQMPEVSDLAGLLICGVYIDLNTIRAGGRLAGAGRIDLDLPAVDVAADQEPFSPDRIDAYLAELTLQPERKVDEPWATSRGTEAHRTWAACRSRWLPRCCCGGRWRCSRGVSGRRSRETCTRFWID